MTFLSDYAPGMKIGFRILGLGAVLLLSLTACGESGPNSTGSEQGGPNSTGSAQDRNGQGAAGQAGASEQDLAGPQQPGAANPFGFEVWHDDYPIDIHLSPRESGRTFDRTRKLALRSILAKVSGQSTRESWLFARDFVGRLDEASIEIAGEELAAALANPQQTNYAENLIEALGGTGSDLAGRVVMRAFVHPEEAVRNKAMAALVPAGNAELVREAFRSVDGLPVSGSLSWAKAAVKHLPPEEAASRLRAIAEDERFRRLFSYLVDIANELEPKYALQVFESYVDMDLSFLRLPLATWRHGAGMSTGTAELESLMRGVDASMRTRAVAAASVYAPERLLDALLERAEKDSVPDVRVAAVEALQAIKDPEIRSTVDRALQTRAYDPNLAVRRAALRALVRRGLDAELDELLIEVRNGTGTRQITAIEDLIHVGYAPAIPALAERMGREAPEERRSYLRALCLMRTPESIEPVRDAFLSEWIDPLTLHDVGIWMSNLPEVELVVLEMFRELKRDDYVRRAVLLSTLGNMSANPDRTEDDFREPIRELCWTIAADDEEVPQLRLQALDQLTRSLTLGDLRRLQRMVATTSDPRFRAYLNSFLFEFY